ncbi:hypothetical protein CDL12_29584 [Handroanthus impetiginosus]|uniref:Uncharacterized protein n=1 Tax=Handroanthus impetiginosus TaxID=429701 RepID=A0A2G9FYE0_9LAMI|nr:hypothetical protein CDL12_29584 [Handroanthus impetiginosus]
MDTLVKKKINKQWRMSSTNKQYRSKSTSELINVQATKLENFCEQEELIQSTAAYSYYYHADYRAMKQQLLFAFKFFALTSVYLFTRSRTPANKIKDPEKSLAVLFLLENLKRVLVYNAHLIHNAKNQHFSKIPRKLGAKMRPCKSFMGRSGTWFLKLKTQLKCFRIWQQKTVAGISSRELLVAR